MKISVMSLDVAGVPTELENWEEGYYIGETTIGGTLFHVEAIQATQRRDRRGTTNTNATNPTFQNRIEHWEENNEGCVPNLVKIGRKNYFVNVEVYAI